jgi:RNA polymerase sigma-70 factor (ECF subfamily)
MGGKNSQFQQTQWTAIRNITAADPALRQQALAYVCSAYWKPVYCYLRRKGCDNEKAKELTQDFFKDVVLGRELIAHADRARGKFRTFLLSALDRYMVDKHRLASARKRMPPGGLVPLDACDGLEIPDSHATANPEQAFTYAWASALLDQVLAAVKDGCLAGGQVAHWAVFHARVVQPAVDGGDPPPLTELCAKHRIDGETKASNMVITVKRRYKKVLREHLRQFVACDDDIDTEISEIMQILAAGRAGV